MALREERLRMSVSVRGGCQPCVTAPLARMISGSGNPQAAWEEEVAQAGSGQGGTRGRLRCVQVRSGELGSCSGFLKPRGIAAGVPRRGRQQVPGSRSQAAGPPACSTGQSTGAAGKAKVFPDEWVSLGSEGPQERCGRGWLIGKQIVWLPPRKSTWSVLFPRFVMKDKDLGEREGELHLIHRLT